MQDEAVKAARQSVTVTINQYKAGTVSYLNVIVVQVIALNNERTAIDIHGRRMSRQRALSQGPGRRMERVRPELGRWRQWQNP